MNPPVIEHIADENRDPKVYWHEKSQAYYMVLFLEGNQFGIFRSENLQGWVCTQTLELDKAWECPDLREIPVEGGGSKWVFWSADGFYFLGEFDGFQFMTDGIRREAYQTTVLYAAQTFFGTEDVITIPWFRMMPVESFLNARELVRVDNTCELKYTPEDFRATQIQLLGAGGISYAAEVNDNEIQFDAETGILTINGEQAFMGRNVHEMSILMDAEICEVTTENGLYYGIFELKPSCNIQEWRICSKEMLSIKVMEIS